MAGQPQTLALVGPPPAMVGGAPLRLQGNVMVRNLDGKQSTETIAVTLGARNDRELELVSGVGEGDRVVIDPASAAANEMKL